MLLSPAMKLGAFVVGFLSLGLSGAPTAQASCVFRLDPKTFSWTSPEVITFELMRPDAEYGALVMRALKTPRYGLENEELLAAEYKNFAGHTVFVAKNQAGERLAYIRLIENYRLNQFPNLPKEVQEIPPPEVAEFSAYYYEERVSREREFGIFKGLFGVMVAYAKKAGIHYCYGISKGQVKSWQSFGYQVLLEEEIAVPGWSGLWGPVLLNLKNPEVTNRLGRHLWTEVDRILREVEVR